MENNQLINQSDASKVRAKVNQILVPPYHNVSTVGCDHRNRVCAEERDNKNMKINQSNPNAIDLNGKVGAYD